MTIHPADLYSTYSIVACDTELGEMGAAVQTHQMSVGSRVLWLAHGVGALATQSMANIAFGPSGLTMLRQGTPPEAVIAGLIASDAQSARRQLALVNAAGQAAAFTGDGCIAHAGHYVGAGYSVQANMMTRPTVIDAMRAAYESATGDLAARMLAALEAAQAEDGDIRGMQSAALKVVTTAHGVPESGRYVYDLRVDEHETPVRELGRLVQMRRAQNLDSHGYAAFERGDKPAALDLWAQARAYGPPQEEMAFWQAVALADAGDVAAAADILRPALANEPRRAHWLDLLDRLETCGLIERRGTAGELKQALGEN
jgi:uncharacterized Ntn-hydrolase superfamily protein